MPRKGENIYKRKDGRWEGRYIKARRNDRTIHYGYVYAYSYKDVRQKLIQLKASHQVNYTRTHPTGYTGTVEEWGRYWLIQVKPTIKPSTYSSYRSKLHCHIFPQLGAKRVTQLSEKGLQKWIETLQATLSNNSTRATVHLLRMLLDYGVKEGILRQNPCRSVTVPKQTPVDLPLLSLSEQRTLYRTAMNAPKGIPILLALEAGLRIGEIAGLKWTDIDFSSGLLTVRRTVQRLTLSSAPATKKTQLIESSPKSPTSFRKIPLSKQVLRRLLTQKETTTGAYVFQGNRPCEPRTIFYWFTALCRLSNVPRVRFHALRHSFATRCIEKGVSIATTSALLGHRSIKLTLDTYIGSFLSEKRKAIRQIQFQ